VAGAARRVGWPGGRAGPRVGERAAGREMREVFEVEAEEICAIVSVTRNHLNVLLYRARMSLRRCLDLHWVADEGVTP